MTELFEIKESKSPQLKWREKHGIKTAQSYYLDDEELPWIAWDKTNDYEGDMPRDLKACGYGMTEQDALLDLTTRVGHWNTTEVKDESRLVPDPHGVHGAKEE